jgi:protoporphyrinogen/coproporphyrinogen III oxidase
VSRASIVVVGGGLSGLAAAWELSGAARGPDDATPRIEVIEASSRVGGSLATTTFAGRTIDLGADGFLARRPEAVALVDELGLSDELEAIGAHGAYLWAHGALHALPEGLVLGVPTDPAALKHFGGLSWRGRAAIRRDQLAPRRLHVGDDATIGEIVRTKLGREVSHQLVEPMVGGIQAGRIDELSAQSVFPALLEAAREGGSLTRVLRQVGPVNPGPQAAIVVDAPAFYTLRNGVGSLPALLADRLEERGVVLRRGVPVTALRRTPAGSYPWEIDTMHTTTPANAVVLAVPAPTVGSLLGSHDQALEDLRMITSAGAAMITFSLALDAITLPPTGTGVLVPLGTAWSGSDSLMTTAVTFLDRKWPHLARPDDVVLRAHVGRSDDARWFEMSDEELTRRASDELAVLLPRFERPRESLVQRWPGGLPQYEVGHELLVRRARAAAATIFVALAGNAYDGVGIPASIGSGRRGASQVREMLAH